MDGERMKTFEEFELEYCAGNGYTEYERRLAYSFYMIGVEEE